MDVNLALPIISGALSRDSAGERSYRHTRGACKQQHKREHEWEVQAIQRNPQASKSVILTKVWWARVVVSGFSEKRNKCQ